MMGGLGPFLRRCAAQKQYWLMMCHSFAGGGDPVVGRQPFACAALSSTPQTAIAAADTTPTAVLMTTASGPPNGDAPTPPLITIQL
jgi:hypothetical protein